MGVGIETGKYDCPLGAEILLFFKGFALGVVIGSMVS
jgi:hypothetical protein